VKHYPDANSQIPLRAIKQSRRVVVDLNNSNINSIAHTNIKAATECGSKSRVSLRET